MFNPMRVIEHGLLCAGVRLPAGSSVLAAGLKPARG